jgi:hypothetical protein
MNHHHRAPLPVDRNGRECKRLELSDRASLRIASESVPAAR